MLLLSTPALALVGAVVTVAAAVGSTVAALTLVGTLVAVTALVAVDWVLAVVQLAKSIEAIPVSKIQRCQRGNNLAKFNIHDLST